MRRIVALLSAAVLGVTGLTLTAPATAAPPPQASDNAHEAVPDELLVGYVDGASASGRERARGRASARFAEQVVPAAADRAEVELVRIPAGSDRGQAIADLQRDPDVAYAEPNWVMQHAATDPPTDTYFKDGKLWGMGAGFGSNAVAAWTNTHTGSADVYVGVIDEGIQFTHPDLDGQVWTNPSETVANGADDDLNGYVDDVHGWDFANNDNSVYDGSGSLDNHGTHVSGTIGAKANTEGVVGVNWNVTLISGKFLGANGGSLANAVKAVDYFNALKAKGLNIVATNNSWGGGGYSTTLHHAIVRAAKAGVLFVAAAGNSGSNNDKKASYPSNYSSTGCPTNVRCTRPPDDWAAYDNVIAVAAIDSNGNRASWSQYGAKTVDLGAPGVGIWSTTANNGGYSSYSGTSMATPHVTGAAALYASTHPGATAAQIKAAILTSAVPTASLNGKTVTGGRLNVSGF